MNRFTQCLLVFFCICALTPSFAQQGARGRNSRIYVTPRPGKVIIDGKLDDWDLSGTIVCYVTQETSAMQSARVAMMYDDEALYVSGAIRDPSPLMNRHDPKVDAARAWDADAFQLRLALDPKMGYPLTVSGANDQLVHMLFWYYTDRKEPCLQLAYGMNYAPPRAGYAQGVVPADKFQGAYVVAKDGRGYTFEYRIPWSTLEARNPPKAGDLVASAIQIQWGAPDGLSSTGGGWAMDLLSQPGFSFQSTACWGKAIFSNTGHLPFALTHEDLPVEPPLPLNFTYRLPKSGDVTVALVNAGGQFVRHLVIQAPRKAGDVIERWDGLDDLGRPLPPGAYTWKGLVHDPITTKYLLSVHNSGHPAYATPDGTGAWGADHGAPSTVCAAGDQMLLAWTGGEAGWSLLRTDLTGRKQWGIKPGAEQLATDGERIYASGGFGFHDGHGVEAFSLQDGRPVNFGRGTPKAEEPATAEEGANEVSGLAWGNGILYVSYRSRNFIALYDAKQGVIKETWAVLAPERLAVRPDGTLAVISAGKVLAVSRGKLTLLVNDHIDTPVSVAVGNDGVIYVANRGHLQDVTVFSPTGKYLRTIGADGGRPGVGRYVPDGMLEPGGIAVDKLGHLWVAETLDFPKRISVWDTKTGTLLNEFFGAGHYATFASMDPQHEDEVYCHNVVWSVDLDKGAWSPVSTMWRQRAPDDPPASTEVRVFTAKNGHQYAWGRWNYARALYLRKGEVFLPVLVSINVTKDNPFIAWPPLPMLSDHNKYPDGSYAWQDANGDLKIQPEEIVPVASTNPNARYGFLWVDANLNLNWGGDGNQYRPVRIEADGRPVYDFSKPEKTVLTGRKDYAAYAFTDPSDGSFYLTDEDGDYGSRGFARWSKDGKLLWRYPVTGSWRATLNKPIPKPGQVWGITQPLGVAGEFTGVATYFGPYHLFTRDGLYVAKLFKDGRLGDTGPDVINAEAFAGQMVRLRKSGRYLLLGGDTDGRVSEILGLNTCARFQGAYTLTATEALRVKEAQAEYARQSARAQHVVIARGRAALDVAGGVTKVVDDARGFTVRLAYDAQNLYVAYDVETLHELTNSIPDPQILFKGGNLLDVQLAADPTADAKRQHPAPGDVRVLITRQQGKPIAVIYRPKVAGFSGTSIVLTSPTGQESFDAIDVTDKIDVQYSKTAVGFHVVATLPLELLKWTPQPNSQVRLDVGYLYGNSSGNQCGQRAYIFNDSPTAAIIGDIPSESRLEPDRWGSATVE